MTQTPTPATPARERSKTVGHYFEPRHMRMLDTIARKTTRNNKSAALQDLIEAKARRLNCYEPAPGETE